MKELLELLVRALVDKPEEVEITENAYGDDITYEIRVAEADLGKVIGRQGRIANALRTVAKAASMKTRRKVFVEIISEGRRD